MDANRIPIRTCDTYESMHPRAMLIALWITPAVVSAQPADAPKPDDKPAEAEPAKAPAPIAKRPEVEQPVPEIAPDTSEPRFTWKPFGYLRLQYIAVQDDPNVA